MKNQKTIFFYLLLVLLSISLNSCKKKANYYDSTIYDVISNDQSKVQIEYDSVNQTIDFNYDKVTISGKINDGKLTFLDKKISSNKINVDKNYLSFDINLKGVRHYIFGYKENSKIKNSKVYDSIKYEIKYHLMNLMTIPERDSLKSKDVKDFIIGHSSTNFDFSNKNFKDGDLVVLFDDYYKIGKLKDDWHIFFTRKTISQKKPFLIVLRKTEGIVNGNRFQDGGLNENQVGFTYSSGNYKKEVKYLKATFVYFDYIHICLAVEDIGYFYYFDKDSSSWKKTYEGLYDFRHEQDYTDIEDNDYFKKSIMSKIYSDNPKFINGIVKNNKIIWNNKNNFKLLFKDIVY
jgi:hypothetical protein